jgi:hypothetical protein
MRIDLSQVAVVHGRGRRCGLTWYQALWLVERGRLGFLGRLGSDVDMVLEAVSGALAGEVNEFRRRRK